MSLRRTVCFGWCPAYEVVVFRDGTVEYVGTQNVKTCSATGHVGTDKLAKLAQLFTRNGFVRLKDGYTNRRLTDAPTIYTSYSPDEKRTKSIEHYGGDPSAPKVLDKIETGVDQILNVEQWIGSEEERIQIYSGALLPTP